MKKLLLVSNIVFTLLLFTALRASAGHKVISGPELEAMMNDGKPVVIVDVREPELYAKKHVPGAV
ncbi:MAG: rhodanese-like domain-containing protein, partial [Deltaproteobacteria bacterium]|nr:rhodanese-like domain-containing protein [Deltaproteobacteria bacterium]